VGRYAAWFCRSVWVKPRYQRRRVIRGRGFPAGAVLSAHPAAGVLGPEEVGTSCSPRCRNGAGAGPRFSAGAIGWWCSPTARAIHGPGTEFMLSSDIKL